MLKASLVFAFLLVCSAQSSSTDDHKIQENHRRILAHNQNTEETYSTKLNQFSSMTHEEYVEKFLSKTLNETRLVDSLNNEAPTMQNDYTTLPSSFDWRKYGLVTSVRYQGTCGTCWSFANIGAVETLHANKYGKLVQLSEQELNDCLVSGAYKNWGCKGGYPSNGFYYAVTKGYVAANVVPYAERDQKCRANSYTKRYKVRGYQNIPYGDENAIKKAVATYGPVTIAIDASEWGFAYYSSGIYVSKTCKPNYNNHAVLIVGYGRERGQDYWIIKNSWGPNWGLVRETFAL